MDRLNMLKYILEVSCYIVQIILTILLIKEQNKKHYNKKNKKNAHSRKKDKRSNK